MKSKKYFGTDGIRGKVGENPITAEFMLRLGWAAGKVFSRQGRGVGADCVRARPDAQRAVPAISLLRTYETNPVRANGFS